MTLDVTAMYAMHDVLRGELADLGRVTVRSDGDPGHILRTTGGWPLFKRVLRIHLSAEDEMLWPVLRRRLAHRQDDLVLLEVMEAEHTAIDQVITAIDEVLADPAADPARLGDLADSLVIGLSGHFTREEAAAIPLIVRFVPPSRWTPFEEVHRRELGDHSRSGLRDGSWRSNTARKGDS
ncbi:MAG TPA: hemerythrin domain-containing protein [Candidatus Limnocylindrales bacterium]